MAPRSKAVGFICNSCRSSVRSFSSSALRSNPIPDFRPTSQPELDSLLSKYRETTFIPENLSKQQRHLIYRPSKRHILANDPGVTVSLSDEEEIRLRPMAYTERPEKRKALGRIASLLGGTANPDAWFNLFPFLEAMESSHEKVPSSFLEKITRKANEHGTHRYVIECAEQAKQTNVRLSDPFVLRELLVGCERRAIEASYTGEAFEKAARQAQLLVYLLPKDEHCRKTRFPEGHFDMRQCLYPNAVMLNMSAAGLAKSASISAEARTEVSHAIVKVLTLARLQGEPSTDTDFAIPQFMRKSKLHALGMAQERLENLLPLWSGLKFASKIPDAVPKISRDRFQQVSRHADAAINAAEADVKKSADGNLDRRSLEMLKQLRKIHS